MKYLIFLAVFLAGCIGTSAAMADGYLVITMRGKVTGDVFTLTVSSKDPAFCGNYKSDSVSVSTPAKTVRLAFSNGPAALGRVLGSAEIVQMGCAQN